MHWKSLLRLSVIFTVFAAITINVFAANTVILRPLSAEEVVRILKLAGREDTMPEGRVVTQGLAAITGFALGLSKGIGGSLLFDLATSNATSEFINNFNVTAMMGDFQNINMTALMQQMFKWDSGDNAVPIRYKTTEICFETRIKDPVVEQWPGQPTVGSPFYTHSMDPISTVTNTDVTDAIDTGTTGAISIGAVNIDVIDTNTSTKKNTITNSGTGNEQTCIVLQKPTMRKRRSSHRRRMHLF